MLRTREDVSGRENDACVACGAERGDLRCGHCGVPGTAGKYRVVSVIARSAQGAVYRAEDEAGRVVALKELVFALVPSTQELDAFEREAALLRQLKHPAIPAFVDAFSVGAGVHTRLYLAQEFVAGQTLEQRLGEHWFDEAQALDVAERLLDALVYLHGRSPPVIHRDIKPANVVQLPDGALKLVDFGAARAVAAAGTHRGTLVGTFGYMAPEQLGGTVEPRSDLYALGATLVHLLARRPPHELLVDGRALAFERAVNVSTKTEAFLRRLVAPRIDDRFASAQAARDFLRHGTTASSTARRRRFQAVVAGALLVPAALVAWALQPRTPPAVTPAALGARLTPREGKGTGEASAPVGLTPPPALGLQGTLQKPPPGERHFEATVAEWNASRSVGLWLIDGSGLGHHVLLPLSGYTPDFFGLRWDGSQQLTTEDDATFAPPGHFTLEADVVDFEGVVGAAPAVLLSRGDPEGAFAWKLTLDAQNEVSFTVRADDGQLASARGTLPERAPAQGDRLRRVQLKATFNPRTGELLLYDNCRPIGRTVTALVPTKQLAPGARVHLFRGVRGVLGEVKVGRLLLKPTGTGEHCGMSGSGMDVEP